MSERAGGWARVGRRLDAWLGTRARHAIIVVAIGATLAAAPLGGARAVGDKLQVVLPILGLGCAVLDGRAGSYMGRYLVAAGIVHGLKKGLGDVPINHRPTGSLEGFPSGHTQAAVFGASSLVHECIRGNPWVAGVAILGAGFTGASRIEAHAHNIWQVLWGAVIGWLCERAVWRVPLGWWRRRRRAAGRAPGAPGREETG